MDIDWKALFLSADGRIKRQPFWIGWIVMVVVSLIASFALKGIHPLAPTVFGLLLIYPNACIYSKRLHDLNKSGWLAAIPFGLSALMSCFTAFKILTNPDYAAAVSGKTSNDPEAAMRMMGTMSSTVGLGLLVFVVSLGFLLWLGIAVGDEGPNKFGPEPGVDDDTF